MHGDARRRGLADRRTACGGVHLGHALVLDVGAQREATDQLVVPVRVRARIRVRVRVRVSTRQPIRSSYLLEG